MPFPSLCSHNACRSTYHIDYILFYHIFISLVEEVLSKPVPLCYMTPIPTWVPCTIYPVSIAPPNQIYPKRKIQHPLWHSKEQAAGPESNSEGASGKTRSLLISLDTVYPLDSPSVASAAPPCDVFTIKHQTSCARECNRCRGLRDVLAPFCFLASLEYLES